jgi:hypothetical protein
MAAQMTKSHIIEKIGTQIELAKKNVGVMEALTETDHCRSASTYNSWSATSVGI